MMTAPDFQLQEENKTLDRMYKTKVEEVTKMTSQIEALEEAVAEASKHVSTIKDLERQNQEMKVGKKLMNKQSGFLAASSLTWYRLSHGFS